MKKSLILSTFLLLALGAAFAYACTIRDRDKYYDECMVRRQCGDKGLCKLQCVNEANKWYSNGCSQ